MSESVRAAVDEAMRVFPSGRTGRRARIKPVIGVGTMKRKNVAWRESYRMLLGRDFGF
jgi:hypothetical protein